MILAVLAFVISFAQGLPPPGNPIVTPPQPVSITNVTQVNVPPMDPQAVSDADAVANQSFVVNTIQPVPIAWDNQLCNLGNFWTSTPPAGTYEFPDLVDLAKLLGAVALALAALAFLGAGLEIQQGAEPSEKIGRILLAGALSVGNLLWWRLGIQLNNALIAVVNPPDFCGSLIKPHITPVKPDVGSEIAGPALVIVYAVVALLALLSLAFRMGMIDFLIASGSLFLFCWSNEHVEHFALWYQRIALGTLFGQVLFAIGLRAARAFANPAAGAAATLLAIVILLLSRQLLGTLANQQVANSGRRGGWQIAALAGRVLLKVF